MPVPEVPELSEVFSVLKRWAQSTYPESQGAALTVFLPDGKRAVLPIPLALACLPSASRVTKLAEQPIRPSADFREVSFHGRRFAFSKTQAPVIETLWLARQAGEPDVDQGVLLRTAHSDSTRLSELFRRSPAWGVLLIPGDTPGTYRLADHLPD